MGRKIELKALWKLYRKSPLSPTEIEKVRRYRSVLEKGENRLKHKKSIVEAILLRETEGFKVR